MISVNFISSEIEIFYFIIKIVFSKFNKKDDTRLDNGLNLEFIQPGLGYNWVYVKKISDFNEQLFFRPITSQLEFRSNHNLSFFFQIKKNIND